MRFNCVIYYCLFVVSQLFLCFDSNAQTRSAIPYKTVKIGTQVWMATNLNVDRFRNGDLIFHAQSDAEWANANLNKIPAWCYFEYEGSSKKVTTVRSGKLYNWYAVVDPRGLAPKGWHIPTYQEWLSLSITLGGASVAGEKMKSVSGWGEELNDVECTNCNYWTERQRENNYCSVCRNTQFMGKKIIKGGGTNSSGFTALPTGERWQRGYFSHSIAGYWSITRATDGVDSYGQPVLQAYTCSVDDIASNLMSGVFMGLLGKKKWGNYYRTVKELKFSTTQIGYGLSIRCILGDEKLSNLMDPMKLKPQFLIERELAKISFCREIICKKTQSGFILFHPSSKTELRSGIDYMQNRVGGSVLIYFPNSASYFLVENVDMVKVSAEVVLKEFAQDKVVFIRQLNNQYSVIDKGAEIVDLETYTRRSVYGNETNLYLRDKVSRKEYTLSTSLTLDIRSLTNNSFSQTESTYSQYSNSNLSIDNNFSSLERIKELVIKRDNSGGTRVYLPNTNQYPNYGKDFTWMVIESNLLLYFQNISSYFIVENYATLPVDIETKIQYLTNRPVLYLKNNSGGLYLINKGINIDYEILTTSSNSFSALTLRYKDKNTGLVYVLKYDTYKMAKPGIFYALY